MGIGKDCAQDHACPVPPQGHASSAADQAGVPERGSRVPAEAAPEQSPGLTQGHIPSARGRRLASPRAFMGPLSTSLRHPSLVSRRGSMTLGWDPQALLRYAL